MNERDRVEELLNSLFCSQDGKKAMISALVDNLISAIKKEVPEWTFSAEIKSDEPKLTQGYTAENWQEIIDGGYLVEFQDDNDNWCQCRLKAFHPHETGTLFICTHGYEYFYCRPAQIKGVMRPIFVEPVGGDEARCVFFSEAGTPLHSNIGWGYRFGSENPRSTRYIEL